MRTLLICHKEAALDREGLVRWLGSFSTVVGTVVIREPAGRRRRRIVREFKRVGFGRFLDVLAFRLHYAFTAARADKEWERRELERLRVRFPAPPTAAEIIVDSPNTPAAEQFIRDCQPDLVVARCKTILKEQVFSIPTHGTFVMHPGICPEYRNAHGCFWAMASGDDANVGMTLLKIDRGVDTGPVFGYFRVMPEPSESHIVTQHRSVLDHLDGIREVLTAIAGGTAASVETRGRRSAAWGQPWLTAYMRMRRRGRAERPVLQS